MIDNPVRHCSCPLHLQATVDAKEIVSPGIDCSALVVRAYFALMMAVWRASAPPLEWCRTPWVPFTIPKKLPASHTLHTRRTHMHAGRRRHSSFFKTSMRNGQRRTPPRPAASHMHACRRNLSQWNLFIIVMHAPTVSSFKLLCCE